MNDFQLSRALLFLIACLLATTGCTTAQKAISSDQVKSIALVVGNGKYTEANPLPNPPNDAKDFARALRDIGFEVIEGINLDAKSFKLALKQFAERGKDSSVGLFYYAGHGIQVSGENFLMPVDVAFDSSIFESRQAFNRQTVRMRDIIDVLDGSFNTRLVFLDACRNNPLVGSFKDNEKVKGRSIKLTNTMSGQMESVNVRQGLAEIEAGGSRNTFIAYATQPGNVALDGSGRNSPFTAALLEHIDTPGLEVRDLLTRTRERVMGLSSDKQIPWDHASLVKRFYFVSPRQSTAPPP